MKRRKKDIALAVVGAILVLMLLFSNGCSFVKPDNPSTIGQDIGVLVLYIAGLAAIKKVLFPKNPTV